MTIKEAENVEFIIKSIRLCKDTPARLIKLHKEGKHEEVLRIACEISSELLRKYEHDLATDHFKL